MINQIKIIVLWAQREETSTKTLSAYSSCLISVKGQNVRDVPVTRSNLNSTRTSTLIQLIQVQASFTARDITGEGREREGSRTHEEEPQGRILQEHIRQRRDWSRNLLKGLSGTYHEGSRCTGLSGGDHQEARTRQVGLLRWYGRALRKKCVQFYEKQESENNLL